MTEHSPGRILVISRPEVEALLTPALCLQRCLETFAWVGAGQVQQVNPVNLYVHDRSGPETPYGHGIVQAFPALVEPLNRAAVKWLGGYRKNEYRGLPAISALDLLTDTTTGMPLALIDGTSVTNMRTGGHAAVGAKFLARSDSSVLTVIGCGNEARTHVLHLNELFNFETVLAFDIEPVRANRFAEEMRSHLSANVNVIQDVREAVSRADIVCVVTTAPDPVVWESWFEPGVHLCAATGFRDVDPACATRFDKWVVGWYERDLAWIEGDEVGRLGGLKPGDLARSDIHADIATDLIGSQRVGRESPDERTIMTHMGMPALDAAVASLVYDLAAAREVGTWIEMF